MFLLLFNTNVKIKYVVRETFRVIFILPEKEKNAITKPIYSSLCS